MSGQNKKRVLVNIIDNLLSIEIITGVGLTLTFPNQLDPISLLNVVLFYQIRPADDLHGQGVLLLKEKRLIDLMLHLIHTLDQIILITLPGPY